MWIFCCGMMRSGSTLQYQITARLVEEAGLGKRIEWAKAEMFAEVQAKYADYKGWKVFKAHVCTEEIKKEFGRNNAKGVYVYRDIRDAFVSMMKKGNMTAEKLLQRPGFIDSCLEEYAKWTTLPGVMVSKYEEMMEDLPGEVARIAAHLGIPCDRKKCEQIASEYTIDKQIERINDFKKKIPSEQAQSTGNVFDPTSLLHTNHIDTGQVGKWKSVLTPKEIAAVEMQTRDWQIANGYELSEAKAGSVKRVSRGHGEVLYYSQNGEDYLLWEFFGHKKEGFYVDIGAFDGVFLSNTLTFEQQGWSGLCVEANPKYFKLCEESRPHAICLNVACVGDEDKKTIEFHEEAMGLFSGVAGARENEVSEGYQQMGLTWNGFKKITVQASTPNAILKKHVPHGTEIDFISIDVEGTELEVLRGLDLTVFRPRVLVMEANTEDAVSDLSVYLAEFGYVEARRMAVNIFYVRNQEDVDRLRKIALNCKIEKTFHPMGEKYTYPSCMEGIVIRDHTRDNRGLARRLIGKILALLR